MYKPHHLKYEEISSRVKVGFLIALQPALSLGVAWKAFCFLPSISWMLKWCCLYPAGYCPEHQWTLCGWAQCRALGYAVRHEVVAQVYIFFNLKHSLCFSCLTLLWLQNTVTSVCGTVFPVWSHFVWWALPFDLPSKNKRVGYTVHLINIRKSGTEVKFFNSPCA